LEAGHDGCTTKHGEKALKTNPEGNIKRRSMKKVSCSLLKNITMPIQKSYKKNLFTFYIRKASSGTSRLVMLCAYNIDITAK